jgi:DNA-binding transcriptional LysR family regulator
MNDLPEPNLADLRALVRASQTGSLSAVARERDVPASQVSRAIDRLEALYGAKLLRRSTHGLRVTPEGQWLLERAQELLQISDDMGSELARRNTAVRGVVRISVSPFMASAQLMPALPALLARYPDLRIEILADDRIIDLASEGVDIAVRAGRIDNDQLVARKIGEHGRAIYASPHYLQRHGTPQEPEQLLQHRCIAHLSAGNLNRWPFVRGKQTFELAIAGVHRFNSTAMVAQAVLSGLGIGRLNTTIVRPWVNSGQLVEVLTSWRDKQSFPIYAVMLPDRRRLARVKVVVQALAAVFAQPA